MNVAFIKVEHLRHCHAPLHTSLGQKRFYLYTNERRPAIFGIKSLNPPFHWMSHDDGLFSLHILLTGSTSINSYFLTDAQFPSLTGTVHRGLRYTPVD